jgi:HD-like signal output (HDOD) protein
MLARLLAVFRRRRPEPPPPAPILVPMPNPRAMVDRTHTQALQAMVADLGGPVYELDRTVWRPLAVEIADRAREAPPPPSFPSVATRVIAVAGEPEPDINELVGAVQRDGAIASAVLRIANSVAFSPAVPIVTLRAAISMLGIRPFVEIVLGSAGRSFYAVASRDELDAYPDIWRTMFDEAMANAFSSGRLALDLPSARGERALLAGLLADVGRPIAMRVLTKMIRDGMPRPPEPMVHAILDDISAEIGVRAIAEMKLPAELQAACIPEGDAPSADSQIARLIASIGAIQRRSPRIWSNAADVRRSARNLHLSPRLVSTLFAQREQDIMRVAEMFGR